MVATLTSFVTPFMGSAVNIALPTIGKEFSIDAVTLGWIATAYLLAAAMCLVPFGRAADIIGRKKVFSFGVALFSISSLLCALSQSGMMLISFRAVQGVGAAMIFGTGVAILTSVFPVGERGRALGISVAAVYLGLSCGPFAGGIITEYIGWRWIFLLNVPLGILILGVVFWKLKGEWAEARGERFDLAGSFVYALMLVCVMYGVTMLRERWGVVLIAAGIGGFVIFVRHELKEKNPVLDVRLFTTNRVFACSNAAALINYSATFAVTFLMSLYLQYIKALSAREAGLILVAQPVVQSLLSPFAGRLSDKIEPRIVASSGMAVTVAGLILFAFLGQHTSYTFIVPTLVLLGVGFAFFSSPNTNAIMSSVEKRNYGVASGTMATMRVVGQMCSMGIVMFVFTLYIGTVQITPEYHPVFLKSVRMIFAVSSVLCGVGIFASLARGKVR